MERPQNFVSVSERRNTLSVSILLWGRKRISKKKFCGLPGMTNYNIIMQRENNQRVKQVNTIWKVEWEYRNQAFKNRINKPSIAKSELPILSIENQKVLEQHISAELTPTSIGILISLYTGLRIGEICALCWNDIDLNARTIYVRHTASRIKSADGNSKTELILDEPKTASSKRVVPIPSPLFYALVEYRKDATSIYVVSSTDSFVSPRTYDARYHRLLSDCHLEDLNYHGLRHTFATRCIEAGVDVKSLSEILGHANVSITLNTYVHSSLEMKKSQHEKLTLLSV